MIGKNLMYTLELMGGLKVLLCGDLQQRPPVCDTALYQRELSNQSERKILASAIYAEMTRSPIILKKVMRQQDPDFLRLLQNCASGTLNIEDWRLLQTRNPDRLPNFSEEFGEALRLYQDRKSVQQFNTDKKRTIND
jgi:hypothetical protein